MASISYLGLNETGKKITRFLNSVLSHIEKIHKFRLQSNVFLFSFLLLLFSQWKATWEIHCCCSSSHSTWCLCTCWGMCTHHRDILFVCTQYRLCRRLLEQTERSSLHSGARGKPLIKQRDRNWPSWWYNLYTRNATNAHSNVISTRAHTHRCVPLYVHIPNYTDAEMGKCVHHVLTDNIYTEENQSVGEKQLVCEQGNTLSLQVSLSLCVSFVCM